MSRPAIQKMRRMAWLLALSLPLGGCGDPANWFKPEPDRRAIVRTPQQVPDEQKKSSPTQPTWTNPFKPTRTEDEKSVRTTNIIAVRTFGFKEPWISFDAEGDRNAEGFKLTVVLESGDGPQGVVGDGLLMIKMYRIDRGPGGKRMREPACEWEFTPEQATPFLSRKKREWGWGYGLRLNWGDADVYGREVEVVASFKLLDGRVIAGTPLSMKVPAKDNG